MNEQCCNEMCESPPCMRVFWPGKPPKLMCVDHATAARNVGSVMGVYIHMEPWSPSVEELLWEVSKGT